MAHHDSIRYPSARGAAPYAHTEEARYQVQSHFVSPSEYLHQGINPSPRYPEVPHFDNTREHRSSMRAGPDQGLALGRHGYKYRSPYPKYHEHLVPHSRGHHFGDHPSALSLSPTRRRRSADIAPPRRTFSLERRDQREQYWDYHYQEESQLPRARDVQVHSHDPNPHPTKDPIIRLSRSHDSVGSTSASASAPKENTKDKSNEQTALSDALLLASVASMARTETKKEASGPSTAAAGTPSNMIHRTTNDAKISAKNRIKTPSPTNTVADAYKAVTPSLSSKFVNELLESKKEDTVKPKNVSRGLLGKISQVSSEDTAVSSTGFAIAAIKNTAARNYDERGVPLGHPLSNAPESFSNSSDYLELDRRVQEDSCDSIKGRDFPRRRFMDVDSRNEFEGRPRYCHDEESSTRSNAPYLQESYHPPPARYPGPVSYYDDDRGPHSPLSRREDFRPPYVDHEEQYHRLPPHRMHSYYPPPPSSTRGDDYPYYHHRPPYYLPPHSSHRPPPHYYPRKRDMRGGRSEYSPHDAFRQPSHCAERQPEPFNSTGKIILRRKCAWKNYPALEEFLIENREEYLRHSAMNYTQEQKQYNNELTERLLDVAKKHNYEFDPADFNFVAIRDRIRCYYKSFVQNCKKRGIAIIHKGEKKRKLSEAIAQDGDAKNQAIDTRDLQDTSCDTGQYGKAGIVREEQGTGIDAVRNDESRDEAEKSTLSIKVEEAPKSDVEFRDKQ